MVPARSPPMSDSYVVPVRPPSIAPERPATPRHLTDGVAASPDPGGLCRFNTFAAPHDCGAAGTQRTPIHRADELRECSLKAYRLVRSPPLMSVGGRSVPHRDRSRRLHGMCGRKGIPMAADRRYWPTELRWASTNGTGPAAAKRALTRLHEALRPTRKTAKRHLCSADIRTTGRPSCSGHE